MSALASAVGPLVLSAPSGVGKTTLARHLVAGSDRFCFSVSATTRARRATERDGVDYHFVTPARFDEMVRDDDLLEWAEVHDHRYGTLRSEVTLSRSQGLTPILDIDVQGALQVREREPGAVLVFVLPPTGIDWLERLRSRGTEDESQLRRRLRSARKELRVAGRFDYVVVNDDVERAAGTVLDVLRVEGLRPGRIPGLGDWIADMEGSISAALG